MKHTAPPPRRSPSGNQCVEGADLAAKYGVTTYEWQFGRWITPKKYPEGTGVRLLVKSPKDIPTVMKLAAANLEN